MMVCLTCQWKLGEFKPMELSRDESTYVCAQCGTTRIAEHAPPVLVVRRAYAPVLYVGGFMLLLLASVVFDAFPQIESFATWTALYTGFMVYAAFAVANLRRNVYG